MITSLAIQIVSWAVVLIAAFVVFGLVCAFIGSIIDKLFGGPAPYVEPPTKPQATHVRWPL